MAIVSFFFFNDTAPTEIYTLSLHDALPFSPTSLLVSTGNRHFRPQPSVLAVPHRSGYRISSPRSEEHTSELQSRQYLVCRLLLEKKKELSLHSHQHPSIPQPLCYLLL